MGHPKKQRKKYESPLKPYDKDRIEREKRIKKEFGLRKKRDIWRAVSVLRTIRRRARALQAKKDKIKEKELLDHLYKLNLIRKDSTIDDVLGLSVEDILNRRLQTIVYKKGLARTAKHARQLIVHNHVLVNNRKIAYPSYFVTKEEENNIKLDSKMLKEIKSEVKE